MNVNENENENNNNNNNNNNNINNNNINNNNNNNNNNAMCRLLIRTSVTRWRLLSSSHIARLRIAASSCKLEAAITG